MRSTPRALLILTLSGTLALASCTVTIGDPERTGASPAPAGSSPSSADEPVAPDAKGMIAAPGRLAVVGADGTLSTMRPDGSGRTEMPQADGRAVQPAWSPQGDRLAWVVQLTSGTGVGGSSFDPAFGVVRKLSTGLQHLAGSKSGAFVDGALATSVSLLEVPALAIDQGRNLYLAETFSGHRVRRVDATGRINAFIGTGTSGTLGDYGHMGSARLVWLPPTWGRGRRRHRSTPTPRC